MSDALDNLLAPLKPYLRPITTTYLPTPLDDFALSLLGPQCHTTLLHDLSLSSASAPCLTLAVSKVLGLAIVTASSIVKLPQLAKLLSSRSAAGLSFTAYALESSSFLTSLAYSARNGFPFSTYGESLFILLQDVAIAVLILSYTNRKPLAGAFLAGLVATAYALLSPQGPVSDSALGGLQALGSALAVASKVPQIYTIWAQGGTGQLSAFAVFNFLAGSLIRVFTTWQEVDDKVVLYGFLVSATFNAILTGQMLWYWNTPVDSKAGTSAAGRREKASVGAGASQIASSTTGAKTSPKGPSTRRRA